MLTPLATCRQPPFETTQIASSRTQGAEQFYVYPFLIGDPYGWVNRSDGVYVNDPREGPVFHLVFKYPVTVGDEWNFTPNQWGQGVWSVLSTDSTLTVNSSTYRCLVYALGLVSDSLISYIEFVAPEIGIIQSEHYYPFENRIIHKKSLVSYQLAK